MVPKVIKRTLSFLSKAFSFGFWPKSNAISPCTRPDGVKNKEQHVLIESFRIFNPSILHIGVPFFCATFEMRPFPPFKGAIVDNICSSVSSRGVHVPKRTLLHVSPPDCQKTQRLGGGNGKQCDKPFCAFSFPAVNILRRMQLAVISPVAMLYGRGQHIRYTTLPTRPKHGAKVDMWPFCPSKQQLWTTLVKMCHHGGSHASKCTALYILPSLAAKATFGKEWEAMCVGTFSRFLLQTTQYPHTDVIGDHTTRSDIIRINTTQDCATNNANATNNRPTRGKSGDDFCFPPTLMDEGSSSQLTVSAIHVIIWSTLGHQCGVVDVSRIRVYGHVWVHLFKQGWEWPSQILQS